MFVENINFTPTMRCNLRCKLCGVMVPHYEYRPHMNEEEWKKTLKLLFEVVDNVRRFQVTGGEPLVHAYLDQTLEEIFLYNAQFEELCFYTLKVFFPDMEDEQIVALYEEANHLGNMNVFLNEDGYKKGCVPCVLYHKDGVGIYPYFAIGEWVHLCIIPVTQEIIDDYAQKGVEIREIE